MTITKCGVNYRWKQFWKSWHILIMMFLFQVCYICKKNYANISEIKHLQCSHFFHKECIENSLKIDALCPSCDEWNESWDDSWTEGWDNSQDDYVMVWSYSICLVGFVVKSIIGLENEFISKCFMLISCMPQEQL